MIDPGTFAALGYEGKFIVVSPHRALTLVHLGKSPVDQRAPLESDATAPCAALPGAAATRGKPLLWQQRLAMWGEDRERGLHRELPRVSLDDTGGPPRLRQVRSRSA